MRGMILAAGRGTRMQALTDHLPKPLLRIGNDYLIEYAIRALVKSGVRDIVINICYYANLIKKTLGNGSRYGANLIYFVEAEALETGGGIVNALSAFQGEPFIVVSADIVTNYPLATLCLPPQKLAHIVLVNNPIYHPMGDFGLLNHDVLIPSQATTTLTYANIAILHPDLFIGKSPSRFKLREVLLPAIEKSQISGEHFHGFWHNVGMPEDLLIVENALSHYQLL